MDQRPLSWFQRDWFLGSILVLAVILVYLPAMRAGFVWDDAYNVTTNPYVVGPLGLKEIWSTRDGMLFPLSQTMFWLEHALWGLRPLPYHLVNVLEQAACGVLLWRVLLGLRVPGAWLGAALWALHPLQVESVAWISEMKNTQACLFYLLTVLSFLRWLGPEENIRVAGRSCALTLIFAALALASKSSTAVLPFVLALCAWWVRGGWSWRNLRVLVPVFFMSVVASTVTLWPPASDLISLISQQGAQTWPERIATAGYVIWFYLGKLIWPYPLMAIYPRWQIDAGQATSYLPLLSAVIILFLLWLKRDSWSRPWFFAFSYFIIALSPFLCLVDQSYWRYSFVEDHLQYLAAIGPLALAGACLARLSGPALSAKPIWQAALCIGLLVIPGVASWQRSWVFENEKTLWNDEIYYNAESWMGQNNLGLALARENHVDDAIIHLRKALELNPNDPMAHYNLGSALIQGKQTDEGIVELKRAMEIDPNNPAASYNLGNSLVQAGRVNEGIAYLKKTLEFNPYYAEACYNLGNAYLQKKQIDDAIAQYQKALEINPDYAEALSNLGNAFYAKGRLDDAVAQYKKALAIDPSLLETLNDLGAALVKKGQVDQALVEYKKALALDPDSPDIHYNLANLYVIMGLLDDAVEQFQEVVRLNPKDGEAQKNLARAEALAREKDDQAP
jgi:protein O-mannosyl-transferase